MLTRASVAKRLGKSIATVRRMEGIELHPIVDERGIHWFEVCEVDALRASCGPGAESRFGLAIYGASGPHRLLLTGTRTRGNTVKFTGENRA